MEILGRYYTRDNISKLLVDNLDYVYAKNILELGIGDGTLTRAASERWKVAKFYAADIDEASVNKVKKSLSFVKVEKIDSLDQNAYISLNIEKETMDIAICNPPYLRHNLTDEDNKVFKEVNLTSCISNKYITTDIIFLAKNLLFLKRDSELAIILPDSIITNVYYESLRKDLLTQHKVKKIIQLPDNIFNKTEARTHILFLKKGGDTDKLVEVSKSDVEGNIVDSILVDKNELQYRMDYDYNLWKRNQIKFKNRISLQNICTSIQRGNRTKKYFIEKNIPYFHTTGYKNYGDEIISLIEPSTLPEELTLAEAGDILIARVGTRCIGKVAIVKKGVIPITDCIYRIRTDYDNSTVIFDALKSNYGQEWLKANAHGVCANVISKKDLINFPILNL